AARESPRKHPGPQRTDFSVAIAQAETKPAETDLHLDLQTAVERLPTRQRDILIAHYWRGLPLAESDSVRGRSKQRTWQIKEAALARLRELLG
ncbi:MAG TPA: sigma factor-like helix-turn-helix DNA-binding protein, partial [Sumerlaeia bacterium]|nr:sigma factor-like helix-turn-helix DNA-binding protein [Sumerlaeia bacterium]